MTVDEVSERILNDNFGVNVSYSEGTSSTPSEVFVDNRSNSLDHYGITGMKWGVRRSQEELGHKVPKRKKKDRRYEDETDQEYQSRMQRELTERQSAAASKIQLKMQKRQLSSQERQQKRQLASQEKQQNKQRKLQEKNQKAQQKKDERQAKLQEKEQKKQERDDKKKTKSKPTDPRHLTDRELNDAIQRLRNEQTYKQLAVESKPLLNKTLIKSAAVIGGVALTVGTAVVKKQLTDIGNMKAEEFLKKKGIDLSKVNEKSKGISEDKVREIIKEMMNNNN